MSRGRSTGGSNLGRKGRAKTGGLNLLVLIRDVLNQSGYQEGFWQRLILSEFETYLFAGLAVYICWCLFAIAGHLKKEAGWIDRLGRFLGIGWIMVALATLYQEALSRSLATPWDESSRQSSLRESQGSHPLQQTPPALELRWKEEVARHFGES